MPKMPLDPLKRSRTQQQFKRDTDINIIMSKYIPPPVKSGPLFGDFANLPTSLQDAMNISIEANRRFSQLPSAVRFRFKNSPQQLFEFLSDASNRDEAVSLGLISKVAGEASSPSPEPVKPPVVSGSGAATIPNATVPNA